jgi:divalent metal cation (Fe/Co/Zn/Cd) transporter
LNSKRLGLLVVGILVLLAGIVFTLQGANVITGNGPMNGNSTYIYVGAVVAIIGLALVAWSTRVGSAKPTAAQSLAPKPI